MTTKRSHQSSRVITAEEGCILEQAFSRCAEPDACKGCEYLEPCQMLIDKLTDMQQDVAGMKLKGGR